MVDVEIKVNFFFFSFFFMLVSELFRMSTSMHGATSDAMTSTGREAVVVVIFTQVEN